MHHQRFCCVAIPQKRLYDSTYERQRSHRTPSSIKEVADVLAVKGKSNKLLKKSLVMEDIDFETAGKWTAWEDEFRVKFA